MTRKPLMLLISLSAAAVSCDDDTTKDAEMRVWVDTAANLPIANPTPDNGDLEAIFVAFDTISVHHTEQGWLERSTSAGFLDLMNPQILPVMLSSWRGLPSGSYDEIRFHVYNAGVVIGDMWFPLEIPSGDESGLKVATSFCLGEDGDIDSLELAWEVADNLHYGERRGYWLTPSIEVWSAPTCTGDVTTPPQPPPRQPPAR